MTDDRTRDWFPPEGEAVNPMKAAQAAMRPPLPKRFYETAAVEERDGAFRLVLDGRPARTPAKNPLGVPTRALAEALAAEWQGQGAAINPAAMPLTRIVNSAIDGVARERDAVIADIAKYAGSDLVCYRAGEPQKLVAEQARAWDPILAWAREALGARFVLSEGVMHVAQPEMAVAAVRARLETVDSPFRLAALHVMTTLTGSVLITLAHATGLLDAGEAWAAAHVDERYQESRWGEDEEALARRAAREADFLAAARVYALAG
ncbi:MAG TPA: ATP12 family protein [Beijerinckiaceae bacterium]|jgi:chaperone required for assembly of F1-ATPase